MQRDDSYALACAEDLQTKANRARSAAHTRKWKELSDRVKAGFEAGDSVWLIEPQISSPFRIDEIHDDFRVKLNIQSMGYCVNPWIHVSHLKPRALFPKRPISEIQVLEEDGYDTALLSEDSWEPASAQDEYEVEEILDLRWIKRTRTSKRSREYLIKWYGYMDPEWISLAQLNCGGLLYEFDQGAKERSRFQTMQAVDDHPGN
ncbi:hypothetical protein PHMEG_00014744 [Phytophthora megakarya]|uniref:Chromo domain-containing protein n=1 Tax=Phytophthora megakarya TaxID=4795 RepID=A0A225W4M0_9STRA|nr:hypothetical protein PHMEG_00014744 [Phytophthora megakarya]